MAKARTEYLRAVPLFAALSDQELDEVDRASDEISVDPGHVVIEQGRVGHEFFLILEGQATVRRDNLEIATLGPGQYFGELALLHRGPRSATVIANTEMTLLVLGQREFAGLLENLPGLAAKFLQPLAQQLRAVDARTVTY
jgi:CRP/FNR family cyclic AMP-dependent transcriptional regulator